ncbi:MAG: hypothetical protein E7052_06350 [Lentisphaerae bacterium]|nr:hypothetical protein [Lentisphaerota bacterium]
MKKLSSPLEVTSLRELFYDDYLISERHNLEFRIHSPVEQTASSGKPCGHYGAIVKTNDKYLYYCRGFDGVYNGIRSNANPGEYLAVSESSDGINWVAPDFKKFPDQPVPVNAIFYGNGFTHNFAPFFDNNPNTPESERFKAVSGVRETQGLFAFYSADGINWQHYDAQQPVISYSPEKYGGHMLDSQNVVFYSEYEKCYVMYLRVWKTADGITGLRTFAKSVSQDFRNWSEPELLHVNFPDEHLYVSTLAPYPRAPQYYIGMPTRYFGKRGSATDVTLIFSRHGQSIQRPLDEAWIKPGLNPARWQNRSNYMAWQIIEHTPEELIFYHGPENIMYKLRTDGFASIHAGTQSGSLLTKVLNRQHGELEVNLSTSAGGGMSLAVCDPSGKAIPGYTFEDFGEFYGDKIALVPQWNGKRFSALPPGPFRLHMQLKECDIYSIAFK